MVQYWSNCNYLIYKQKFKDPSKPRAKYPSNSDNHLLKMEYKVSEIKTVAPTYKHRMNSYVAISLQYRVEYYTCRRRDVQL